MERGKKFLLFLLICLIIGSGLTLIILKIYDKKNQDDFLPLIVSFEENITLMDNGIFLNGLEISSNKCFDNSNFTFQTHKCLIKDVSVVSTGQTYVNCECTNKN